MPCLVASLVAFSADFSGIMGMRCTRALEEGGGPMSGTYDALPVDSVGGNAWIARACSNS